MNILLSAYACEPNKGSEPGVGWDWAIELAKNNNVWVITRDNNEPTISAYLKRNPEYRNENLHFIYVGLSKKLTFWKKGRRGMRLFYMMWQKKAVKVAKQWNEKVHFDLVQHVTFVSYTQPTYMYKLGIPMVWGPVAGGENIPDGIQIKMSAKERVFEKVRRISQSVALLSLSTQKTMKYSKAILVATEETMNKIPMKYQNKAKVIPAIGLSSLPKITVNKQKEDKIRIIMAGRLIYLKAFDIGVKAFLEIADKFPNAELHILGEGPEKQFLREVAGEYFNTQIFFDLPVQHDAIYDYFSGFDLFINTSLHDSGCMTMMEAMSVGVPCVAIATGGPKVLLKEFPECSIAPESYEKCVNQLSIKMEELLQNQDKREQLAREQLGHAQKTFTIAAKLEKISNIYVE